MKSLLILKELQATIDHLRTVDRDLKAFPPDLAQLDQELKAFDKRIAEIQAALEGARPKAAGLRAAVQKATAEEAAARAHLKAATEKVQYAHAIRDIEDKERTKHAAERPLKDLDGRIAAAEAELAGLEEKASVLRARFDELHAIFLSEHENQVAAKVILETKRAKLEATLPAPELVRFKRLIHQRMGRAVVAAEKGQCDGCHTKLRPLVVNALREGKSMMACESCSRILFWP